MNPPPLAEPERWEQRGRRTLVSTRIFDLQSVQFRHPVRATERDSW